MRLYKVKKLVKHYGIFNPRGLTYFIWKNVTKNPTKIVLPKSRFNNKMAADQVIMVHFTVTKNRSVL